MWCFLHLKDDPQVYQQKADYMWRKCCERIEMDSCLQGFTYFLDRLWYTKQHGLGTVLLR